jgi:acetylornithine deacetylase/succinyl-diaminopimelate desuccinylase-like protein
MLARLGARAAAIASTGWLAAASAQAPDEAARAAALEIYSRIVAFDTSIDGGQTQAMASWLAERFRAGGFADDDVRVMPHAATAALTVRYRGDGSGGRAILLLAHMDVVPARRAEWERDPFTLIEENGFFFGRGSIDNKASVALITATFLQLRAEGFRPTRDLILWFSGDEETTGETTTALLTQHRAWLGDAEYALNSDSGGGLLSRDGLPTAYYVQTAEKTYADFTLTARNSGGHSSLPRADNAIFDLVDAIGRIRAYAFPVMWNDTTIESFRAVAAQVGGDDGAAMLRFAQRPGDRDAAAILSRAATQKTRCHRPRPRTSIAASSRACRRGKCRPNCSASRALLSPSRCRRRQTRVTPRRCAKT